MSLDDLNYRAQSFTIGLLVQLSVAFLRWIITHFLGKGRAISFVLEPLFIKLFIFATYACITHFETNLLFNLSFSSAHIIPDFMSFIIFLYSGSCALALESVDLTRHTKTTNFHPKTKHIHSILKRGLLHDLQSFWDSSQLVFSCFYIYWELHTPDIYELTQYPQPRLKLIMRCIGGMLIVTRFPSPKSLESNQFSDVSWPIKPATSLNTTHLGRVYPLISSYSLATILDADQLSVYWLIPKSK